MTQISASQAEAIVRNVVDFAKDDWVGLWVIFSWVKEQIPASDPRSQRAATLAVVEKLLQLGLKVGDTPYSPGGFKEWTDQKPTSVVARIEKEWDALGEVPDIGDIASFG